MFEEIGNGHFGIVRRGKILSTSTPVALKELKPYSTAVEKMDFLLEAITLWDIAARNCLISRRESQVVVKIADFGMARDVTMAFGVLMWEIYTGAQLPYGDFTIDAVMNHIIQGGKLDKPTKCSNDV
ncbi:insulin-like growth factor 1 receptor, partial [Saccostrea cucullata]|uniref:insulin-like growth factor 1 receptor n=1 Tax=Saccostrea cuccullata TaxID=36930 RepID=UPI002ED014A1